VQQEVPVLLVPLEQRVSLEHQVSKVHQGQQALLDLSARQELPVLLVLQVFKELLARQVRLVRLVQPASLELVVFKELLARQVRLVRLEQPASPELVVFKELLARQVQLDL